MRVRFFAFAAGLHALGIFSMLPGQKAIVRGQGQETLAWAPVPNTPTGWTLPTKPIWKLKDILAEHSGQPNWTQTVVSDNLLHADYISMAPGGKTPRRFHPDNVTWMDRPGYGQIRFTIEGQEPFLASKGWLVQVPIAIFTVWKPWRQTVASSRGDGCERDNDVSRGRNSDTHSRNELHQGQYAKRSKG
jgi:hypothetical protein